MTETNELLSSTEVCGLAGITFRQLDHWARIGRIRPAVPATGSGSRRRFSWDDAEAMDAVGRVSRAIGQRDELLDAVARNWSDGRLELSEGVTISWSAEAQ